MCPRLVNKSGDCKAAVPVTETRLFVCSACAGRYRKSYGKDGKKNDSYDQHYLKAQKQKEALPQQTEGAEGADSPQVRTGPSGGATNTETRVPTPQTNAGHRQGAADLEAGDGEELVDVQRQLLSSQTREMKSLQDELEAARVSLTSTVKVKDSQSSVEYNRVQSSTVVGHSPSIGPSHTQTEPHLSTHPQGGLSTRDERLCGLEAELKTAKVSCV